MSIIVVHFFLTSMNIIGSGRFCSRSEIWYAQHALEISAACPCDI